MHFFIDKIEYNIIVRDKDSGNLGYLIREDMRIRFTSIYVHCS
jgi:hypothetical protein